VAQGEKLSTVGQPTARRRRHANSANSVTVAELLAKSTPAEQTSLSEIQAKAASTEASTGTPPYGRPAMPDSGWAPVGGQMPDRHGPPTEPVRMDELPDGHVESNGLAMTIVATVVIMIGCGVFAAAAVLTGERADRLSPSTPIVQPAVITGAAIVRPDAMIEQLNNGSVRPITTAPYSGRSLGRSGLLAERDAAARLVKQFYDSLPLRTREAFALLGPTMQANAWKPFDKAWTGTRSVEVRVLPPDPSDGGLLRVSVSIEQFDGTLLKLVLRIEVRHVMVDDIPQLRIVGAQLLSAHRT